MMNVTAWQETITIPTYKLGAPDKNPMFLENRVYQGSSGVVYPHAVIDKVYDEKENKEWIALFLENEYLKVMILPELGGRIQMAFDKTNDYHFIYYNSVIKPALVGLAGPWISGGIEFNWPQHHRPSTFDPIDFSIEENSDGSKTVWVNEYEKMFRTKCLLGFTLHPGKSYIELHTKLLNRTPFPQTFLWWANPAVAVDEHYQSVFPPDVHAVFDHGKRDVSSFPIAKGTYYKVDYSPGTDISRYTNIPVPTSYMAVDSEFNFVGGYHHKREAGMLHVADHHVSPGKKQWTWGCGEFGQAWDRQLTDNDGPYFELMCGMFTDNQPDFSWIMPNETREFKQYFMPYKNIGYVKNATIEAAVNLEFADGKAFVKVYLTEEKTVIISLRHGSEIVHTAMASLLPRETYSAAVDVTGFQHEFSLEVTETNGRILVSYTPVARKEDAIPDPAKAIASPADISTVEELYLAGLHLEQYRHATYAAEDYYEEGLRRDKSDLRCNNAMGLLLLRRGQVDSSEAYFRRAVEKLIRRNPNPFDSEPLYYLGLSLKYQGKMDEAYTCFFKSTWNAALQDVCYLQLAYISSSRRSWQEALDQVEKSLSRNTKSLQARQLKASLLRKLNRFEDAIKWIDECLEDDRFDFGTRFEKFRIGQDAEKVLAELINLARSDDNTFTEISIDYANAGLYEDAFDLLILLADVTHNPLTFYYMGYYTLKSGFPNEAVEWFERGFQQSPDKVFPNRIEDIEVLESVIANNPKDFKASYYLGNYYYAKRRYEEARTSWELSAGKKADFATVYRNLGIAYFNKFNLKDLAFQCYEKAFSSDPSDSRVLFELDQLARKLNQPVSSRLNRLEDNIALVDERDDLYTELISLYVLTGQLDIARQMLATRNFHPWEGGEGKVSGLHVIVHVELAKHSLWANNALDAISLLKAALLYPQNLGEGKLYGAQENDIYYWLGCAYEMSGNMQQANDSWSIASTGLSVPSEAIFYNDQQPDKIFYQGLALEKTGQSDEAHRRYQDLVKYGEANKGKQVKMDYFAVSLPDLMIFNDDLSRRNDIHCDYLIGLGHLGARDWDLSKESFDRVLTADSGHMGAHLHKRLINNLSHLAILK